MTAGTSLARALVLRLMAAFAVVLAAMLAAFMLHLGETDAAHPNAEVHAVIVEFVFEIMWAVPLAFGASAFLVVLAVRRALAPLRAAAEALARAAPGAPARLSSDGLPAEIRPFVEAVDAMGERLQAAIRRQRDFVVDAAHELRTPLALLRSGAEAVPEGKPRAELLAHADRMARVVAQLTALARAESREAGGAGLDAAGAARAIAASLAPLALARGVDLSFEGSDARLEAPGTQAAFEDVARNLVENALQHARTRVVVRVERGPTSALYVEDDGPGVPADMTARVFDRFFRGAWSAHDGSGLGLAIAAEAATRSGLRLEAAPGPGGRFAVRW